MEIRHAQLEDAPAMLALQYRAYQSEAALYDDPQLPPLTETVAQLEVHFRDHVILKATRDEVIVGTVRARLENGTVAIGRLAVDPNVQGQGIGTRLLQAIEEHFPQATRFELFTGHRSSANLRLYQRLGYQIVRHQPVDANVTLVYLEKAGQRSDTAVLNGPV